MDNFIAPLSANGNKNIKGAFILAQNGLTTGKFYTDLNLINLPIFSASKVNKVIDKEIITLDVMSKTVLNIQYDKGIKPTFFDRKIFALIEYIYCTNFNFDEIKILFDKEYDIQKANYLKAYNINEEDLTNAGVQNIIYSTGTTIMAKHQLFLTFADLSNLFNKFSGGVARMSTDIKASLRKLGNTRIDEKTTYLIDNSKFESSPFSLINYYIDTHQKTHHISISLSPFHFLNLLSKRYVESNIKLLSSFDSPIAGRLSEYLSKKLYGSKKYNKHFTRVSYKEICTYLHLKQHDKKSYILQQLEKPFNELIDKKIIEKWQISKQPDLFGLTFDFFYNWKYYSYFFDNLEEKTRILIDTHLAELIEKDNDLYKELEAKKTEYIEDIPAKEQTEAGNYFLRHLYYTQYYNKI